MWHKWWCADLWSWRSGLQVVQENEGPQDQQWRKRVLPAVWATARQDQVWPLWEDNRLYGLEIFCLGTIFQLSYGTKVSKIQHRMTCLLLCSDQWWEGGPSNLCGEGDQDKCWVSCGLLIVQDQANGRANLDGSSGGRLTGYHQIQVVLHRTTLSGTKSGWRDL